MENAIPQQRATVRSIAFGVVAAAALFYAGVLAAAAVIIVTAAAADRLTLIMAGVVVVGFGGLAAALLVGIAIAPAYFIARPVGMSAWPFVAWGAGLFGLVGWRWVAPGTVRDDLAVPVIIACALAGALEGAAFYLGVRRSATSGRS